MALNYRTSGITPFSGNSTSRAYAVDVSAQAGDWMYIICFTNDGTKTFSAADPSTVLVQDVVTSTLARVALFKRKLVTADIGSSVTINLSAAGLAVGFSITYSGGDATEAITDYNVSFLTPSTSRTLPTLTSSRDGSVEFFALFDKVTSTELTSSFTLPAGTTKLQEAYATASGLVSGVLGRVNATYAAASSAGGQVVTADHAPAVEAAVTVVIAPAVNAQYARPTSDVTKTSVSATPAVSVFAGNIDEAVLDTSDYVSLDAVGAVYETKLGALVDPQVSTGHIVSYTLAANPGSTSASFIVSLVQGTTVIHTWTYNNVTTTPTTFTETLSGTEADSITSYSDLRLRFALSAAS